MSTLPDLAPTSAARALREATGQAHAGVEALPRMAALAAGTLDADDYGEVLLGHAAILAPWERAHAAWLATLPAQGWTYRPRMPALRHDLAALGLPARPDADDAPVPADADAAWGMLYVIEGSMLGGRVIARQLRLHQPRLAGALAYFDLGSDDPAAWRRFQACLESALPDADARQRAAAGAVAMFAHFHQHLASGMPA